MVRHSMLTLAAVAAIAAAAAMYVSSAHQPHPELSVETGDGYHAHRKVHFAPHYGYHSPNYGRGHILERCLSEPIDCGLVVW